MPTKPKHPCNKPGCPQLTSSRFCPEHTKQYSKETDSRRGSRIERGYTNSWVRYSRMYRMNNPLCVVCQREGRVVASEHVDHITPVEPTDPWFWDKDNHQALCKSCHSKKTAIEDGGWGR